MMKYFRQTVEWFWGISRIERRDLKPFFANHIHQIKSHTDVSQWQYISAKENPADDYSRGLEMKQ